MKKIVRCLWLLVVLLLLLCPLSVSAGDKEDAIARLVENVNAGEDIWDQVVYMELPYTDTEAEPHNTHFTISDMTLSPGENGGLAYTCTVTPCLSVAFNQAYDSGLVDFFDSQSKVTSPVMLSGELLLTDDNKVLLSDGTDPFSLYIALRYMTRPEKGATTSDKVNHYLTYGSFAYGRALGTDYEAYAENVVIPELNAYYDSLNGALEPAKSSAGKPVNKIMQRISKIFVRIVIGGVVLLFIVYFIGLARDKKKKKMEHALSGIQEAKSGLDEAVEDALDDYHILQEEGTLNDLNELEALYVCAKKCREEYNYLISAFSRRRNDEDDKKAIKRGFGISSYRKMCKLSPINDWKKLAENITLADEAFRNARYKSLRTKAEERDYTELGDIIQLISEKEADIVAEKRQREEKQMEDERRIKEEARRRDDFRNHTNHFKSKEIMIESFWTARAYFLKSKAKLLPEAREYLQTLNRYLTETDTDTVSALWEKLSEYKTGFSDYDKKNLSILTEDAELLVALVTKALKNADFEPLWKAALEKARLRALRSENMLYAAVLLAETANDGSTEFPQFRDFALSAQAIAQDAAALHLLEKKQRDAVYENVDIAKAIKGALTPESFTEENADTRFILDRLRNVKNEQSSSLLSELGWTITAVLRHATMDAGPDLLYDYESQLETAIESYNSGMKQLDFMVRRYNKCVEEHKKSLNRTSDISTMNLLMNEIVDQEKKFSGGLCGELLKMGKPVHAMLYLLTATSEHHDRFIYQCIIMGMLPYLMKYRAELKPYFDNLLAKRSEMISSDDSSSFFEVRVPYGIYGEAYAKVLRFVLESANPSLPYCDLNTFLKTATTEVPNCMELLWACPLRLIDPVNRTTLGFYLFKPYNHLYYTVFVPPKGVGQVQERYHQVDDMTTPLASGLQLLLFCDPYSVIPTLFHENEHFIGDRNEASVFLKTQMFSVEFYRKYADAKPQNDGVFATLTELLGIPADKEKTDALNALIEQYYGKQISEPEAEKIAEQKLNSLNMQLNLQNMLEKWCPEVKFPLLGKAPKAEDEKDYDEKSGEMIREITIRYATTPKSITKDEFAAIVNQ